MKRFFKYLLVTLLLAIAVLCTYIYFLEKVHVHIAPNRDRTFYQPDTTVFAIPISLSVNDIENLANLKLKPVLFDGKLPVRNAKDTLNLKISRAGHIRFNLHNNLLTAIIPLDAEAFYRLRTIGKKSTTFFKGSPLTFSLNIRVETPVVLNNHYGFVPQTKIKSIDWKIPPVIKLGPLQKDISEEAEEALYKKEDQVTAKLDSVIRQKITLREPMQKIWTKLQRPIPLKLDKGRLFLYLYKQPLSTSVWLEPGNTDSLHFMMRLKSLVYILHARDTLRFKTNKLPRQLVVLKQAPTDDTTRFHVQVCLPLREMEKICNERIAQKGIVYAGYKIQPKKVHITNGQKHMLLSLGYKGDFNGEVRLKGTPTMNIKNQMFDVDNLEFETREDNLVIKGAEKFFHTLIRDRIREAVQIDMARVMDTLPLVIQGGIERSKLSSKADVQLQCFEIKKVKTNLTMQYVQFMVSGCAQVKMNLKKEAIIKKPGT